MNCKEDFKKLHNDAVLWKAEQLWLAADDADSQGMAMEQLVTMICCIDNDTKRSYYIDEVQKKNKIKNSLLKKGVKDLLQKIEAKKQAEIVKRKLEAQFNTVEDAGLPKGFNPAKLHDALKYGIYEHEGVYYTKGGGRGSDYVVSNFTMRILYHTNTGTEEAYRLIAVKNVYGFETFINMNTDNFVALGTFKKELAKRGNYIFKGTDSDLCRLQEYLQRDEVPTLFIKSLGWFKRGKFYAFANGIMPLAEDGQAEFQPIDEYGIITHGSKNYFLPALSKLFSEKDEMYENEKKFRYTEPIEGFDFAQWSGIFLKTFGQKAIAGILFYIGALFRDVVMKQVQRFPILNLFGPPGAGKGGFAESLMFLFGEKQKPIGLEGASTPVGFMRKFGQLVNAFVWADEYKNTLPSKLVGSLKNIYDGTGYERGKMSNDFATESTPISSSCILSGQDMPTVDSALFMRVIMLTFEEGKFTEEQRTNYSTLKEIELSGLAYITASLVQHRDFFEKNFKIEYERIFRHTYKVDVTNSEVDTRMIVNISMLLTFYHLFKDKLKFPFTYVEAKTFLIDNMLQQHNILASNNDVAKFWDVIQSIFAQGLIDEDKDFELKDGYIYLRLLQVYPNYLKEMRQRGDASILAKSTLDYYLRLDKTIFVEHKKKRFDDQSNNWCLVFKYARLQELYQLDLIRMKKGHWDSGLDQINKLEAKQKEMGVHVKDNFCEDEELPFGKTKAG